MSNLISILDDVQTMSSREIADLTGKQHKHILTDVRNMLKELGLDALNFKGIYKDKAKHIQPCFNLPLSMVNKLLARYEKVGIPYKAKERVALTTIEQVLNIQLIRNFKVLDFYIDGYDAINCIAYEIDEVHHQHHGLTEQHRQSSIEKILDCTFVRIKV
jgi:hypothetical protein